MPAVAKRSRKPRPRWQRRKAARPAEIVTAALDVFVERGFAAARLEEVARRAGVTKGTVYLYFKNKEALFKAVVRETIVPVIAKGEALAQTFTGSARDLVERLVREYWRLIGETALAGMAFGKCMPEGFNVVKYLDTHIDLYLHGIAKSH